MKKIKYRRPQGLTLMVQNQNQDRMEVIRYVLKTYLAQGFQWNNKPTSIEELSQLLNINPNTIIKEMGRMGRSFIKIGDKDKAEEGLNFIALKWMEGVMRDRYLAEENVRNLDSAMYGPDGNRVPYKAFVSAEYTKAISTLMGTHKSLEGLASFYAKMANMGQPSQQGPTINITNQNQVETNQNFIDVKVAMDMLAEAKGQVLMPESQMEALEAHYLQGSPDINPATQSGYGTDRALINVGKDKDHGDRREGQNELNLLS
jgi:hypothetical protein